MPKTPTPAEVIRRAIVANREELHVALPGIVHAVNASRGTVDVTPQLRRPIERRDGTFAVEDLPIIPDVPVIFARAGGFSIKLPVAIGDPVQLLINERDIGMWREQGEPGVPGDNRAHSLAGAVAIPGIFTNADAPKIPGDNMEIGKEGVDAAIIEITDTEVRLTRNSSNAIARADRVEAELATLESAISGAPTTLGDGGAAFKAAIIAALATWPGNTGTDNVKGD